MTRFGEMLAELRNDKGLSQKSLLKFSICQAAPYPVMKLARIFQMQNKSSSSQIFLMLLQIICLADPRPICLQAF